jgi:hypothetical protein
MAPTTSLGAGRLPAQPQTSVVAGLLNVATTPPLVYEFHALVM